MGHAMTASDSFHRSLWSALTPHQAAPPRALGSLAADVAIVGGGLFGLSTALALAEAGSSVIVLESHWVGFGASGRSTGSVVPSLKGSLGLEEVSRLVGPEHARALLRLIGAAGSGLFDLVRRLGIACDAEQTGCLQLAPHPASLAVIEKQVRSAGSLGIKLRTLDAAQTVAASGIPGYLGALLFPTGGQINPLALVRGPRGVGARGRSAAASWADSEHRAVRAELASAHLGCCGDPRR